VWRQDSNGRYGRIFGVKRFLSLGLAVFLTTAVALAGKAEPPVMDAWPALLTACAKLTTAAHNQHLRWKVVCPRQVPRVSDPVLAYAGGYLSQNNLTGGYGFGASSDSGRGSGYGHWTFESGARRRLLNGLFDINAVGKANATVSGPQSLRIAGQPVKLYRVAPGMSGYADHVAIVWTVNQQMYMVTVHRWSTDALAKVQAVAMTRTLLRGIA
jgi:hypothetical protein